MRRSHSSVLFSVALVGPGCVTDLSPAGVGETDGIDLSGTGSETGDPTDTIDPTASGTDGTGTTDPDPTEPGGSSGEPECAGDENECGGCDALPENIGDPCNGCDEMAWECDGADTVVCGGYDPDATEYFPDADEDGFGDASHDGLTTCEAPEGWVFSSSDCDDDNDEVHPDATEICNGIDDNCDDEIDEGPTEFCDDVCCSFELACDGTACVPKCDEGEICGADLDVCCGADEVCFANDCVVPGANCEFTEECPLGEVCAQATGQCVPEEIVPECEFVPPVGEFEPVVGCQSDVIGLSNPQRDDVVATPIVINVTDDDTPDIVFLTYDRQADGCCNTEGTIRIYSGGCEDDGSMLHIADLDESLIFDFNGTGYMINNDSGLAAADLNGDGSPEIVAITKSGTANNNVNGTVAFTRTADDGSTWEVLWHNVTYPTWTTHTRGGAVVSIADLDADGNPEIITGNVVLNGQDGTLLWDGKVTAAAAGKTGGVGNNGFLGPSSAVADIDNDGMLEVAAGNTVYEHDGTVKWEYDYVGNNSTCGGSLPCDGFNAVADFDDDPEGEVVIVRLGEVFVIDDDGTEMHRAALPDIDCNYNEAGPPTVADFDNDGRPEIGTASADYYVVVDWDCDPADLPAECAGPWVLWQVQNEDCTSRVTASSVFDFEGDGAAEVVYADEQTMRIFDGSTGAVLFTDSAHDSHTRIEMPVIADVDNDGNAEIVIPENEDNSGVIVWEDASDNWVRTRRVWNQHAYSITHITESGVVPAVPEINWQNERFNNFRQNVQPDGLFHAPDAVLDGNICGPRDGVDGWEVDLSVLVRNDGALTMQAGTPVEIELHDGAMVYPLLTTATTIDLQPGQFEVLVMTLGVPAGLNPPFTIRAIVDPSGEINECNEDNNLLDTLCAIPE